VGPRLNSVHCKRHHHPHKTFLKVAQKKKSKNEGRRDAKLNQGVWGGRRFSHPQTLSAGLANERTVATGLVMGEKEYEQMACSNLRQIRGANERGKGVNQQTYLKTSQRDGW